MNKTDVNTQDLTSAATAAAANAAAAAATASTAIISNDISWMKVSLGKIEKSLADIGGAFVSQVEFLEVKKMVEDHEIRQRTTEKNQFTWMGSFSIINVVAMIIISLLSKFIK